MFAIELPRGPPSIARGLARCGVAGVLHYSAPHYNHCTIVMQPVMRRDDAARIVYDIHAAQAASVKAFETTLSDARRLLSLMSTRRASQEAIRHKDTKCIWTNTYDDASESPPDAVLMEVATKELEHIMSTTHDPHVPEGTSVAATPHLLAPLGYATGLLDLATLMVDPVVPVGNKVVEPTRLDSAYVRSAIRNAQLIVLQCSGINPARSERELIQALFGGDPSEVVLDALVTVSVSVIRPDFVFKHYGRDTVAELMGRSMQINPHGARAACKHCSSFVIKHHPDAPVALYSIMDDAAEHYDVVQVTQGCKYHTTQPTLAAGLEYVPIEASDPPVSFPTATHLHSSVGEVAHMTCLHRRAKTGGNGVGSMLAQLALAVCEASWPRVVGVLLYTPAVSAAANVTPWTYNLLTYYSQMGFRLCHPVHMNVLAPPVNRAMLNGSSLCMWMSFDHPPQSSFANNTATSVYTRLVMRMATAGGGWLLPQARGRPSSVEHAFLRTFTWEQSASVQPIWSGKRSRKSTGSTAPRAHLLTKVSAYSSSSAAAAAASPVVVSELEELSDGDDTLSSTVMDEEAASDAAVQRSSSSEDEASVPRDGARAPPPLIPTVPPAHTFPDESYASPSPSKRVRCATAQPLCVQPPVPRSLDTVKAVSTSITSHIVATLRHLRAKLVEQKFQVRFYSSFNPDQQSAFHQNVSSIIRAYNGILDVDHPPAAYGAVGMVMPTSSSSSSSSSSAAAAAASSSASPAHSLSQLPTLSPPRRHTDKSFVFRAALCVCKSDWVVLLDDIIAWVDERIDESTKF
jgi:hypothetical protein